METDRTVVRRPDPRSVEGDPQGTVPQIGRDRRHGSGRLARVDPVEVPGIAVSRHEDTSLATSTAYGRRWLPSRSPAVCRRSRAHARPCRRRSWPPRRPCRRTRRSWGENPTVVSAEDRGRSETSRTGSGPPGGCLARSTRSTERERNAAIWRRETLLARIVGRRRRPGRDPEREDLQHEGAEGVGAVSVKGPQVPSKAPPAPRSAVAARNGIAKKRRKDGRWFMGPPSASRYAQRPRLSRPSGLRAVPDMHHVAVLDYVLLAFQPVSRRRSEEARAAGAERLRKIRARFLGSGSNIGVIGIRPCPGYDVRGLPKEPEWPSPRERAGNALTARSSATICQSLAA